MDAARVISGTVDGFATGLGFVHDGDNWFREGSDIVWVLRLHHPQHGVPHDLDIGLWFTELGARTRPPLDDCHVRSRLSRLLEDGQALESLVSSEARLDGDTLAAAVEALLDSVLRPVLDRVTSRLDLAADEATRLLQGASVKKVAHRLIPPR